MKNLIFGILLLLCLQVIHVEPNCSDCIQKSKECRAELAALRTKTKEFIGDISLAYNKAFERLAKIQKIFEALSAAVLRYSSGQYRSDLNGLRCEMKAFLKDLEAQRLDAYRAIAELINELEELLQLADQYAHPTNLTCTGVGIGIGIELGLGIGIGIGIGVGCEAEINRLRCDISSFLNDFKGQYKEAQLYLLRLRAACGFLGGRAIEFSNMNDLTCAANGCASTEPEFSQLRANVNSFMKAFKYHPDLARASDVCAALKKTIDTWVTRVAKF